MKNSTALSISIAVLILFGCRVPRSGKAVNHPQAHATSSRVEEGEVLACYDRARTSLLSEKQVFVDVLWVLNQFAGRDPKLVAFIENSKASVPETAYVPGVFPDLPRIELPENPGTGISKFFTYVQAAFGVPEDRAVRYLMDYTEDAGNGYILTHQFLSLVWAEQAGLPVPEKLQARRQGLWKKVYEEQSAADRIESTDLYMERVAIVLSYGRSQDVDRDLADAWIRNIMGMQLDDGSWPLSRIRISYDGASTLLSSPRAHTTVLAMMALDAYLQKEW